MNNFLKALIALLLIQFSFGKPVNEENISNEPASLTEFQRELLYVTEENRTEFFGNRIIQTARQTLNNPLMLGNHNEEVENFKKNLTTILNKYDEMKKAVVVVNTGKEEVKEDSALIHNIIVPFFNLIEYYFELPQGQQTADQKLIVETLTKYTGDEIYMELARIKAIASATILAILKLVIGGQQTVDKEINILI